MRLLLVVLTLAILPVKGDDWAAPVMREVFSKSRSYFVRVIPGKSLGDTVGFRGMPKGPFAVAEVYHLQKDRSYRLETSFTLLNPVAPADFFVTEGGYLITLDNWHNIGYGKIVGLYRPNGEAIRNYELRDLFTQGEIDKFSHSESSIQWRKSAGTYIGVAGDTLHVTVNDGGSAFIFEVNGSYQYCETQNKTFVCRAANQNRRWLPFREP